jgi:hypothetical protein
MTALITWPAYRAWRMIAGIIMLVVRLVAVLVGLALAAVGIVLTLTVIGSVVGLPLTVTGWEMACVAARLTGAGRRDGPSEPGTRARARVIGCPDFGPCPTLRTAPAKIFFGNLVLRTEAR